MATLTVIAGLPGSGKSTLVEAMKRENPALALAEPDYIKDSINNINELTYSKHHHDLVAALRQGRDCVIADIQFVTHEKQEELINLLINQVHLNITIHLIMFDNDWKQCVRNVLERAGDNVQKFAQDVQGIINLTLRYRQRLGADTLPVYKPPR